MSKTRIECEDPLMLSTFMHAALFFTGAAITYDLDEGWLLLEDGSDWTDQIYKLDEDGLTRKE